MRSLKDWRGRSYECEVAFVRFLGGYVAWIDDDPFRDGESFNSKRAAWEAVRDHMEGRG